MLGKQRDTLGGPLLDRLAAVLPHHPVHSAYVREKPAPLGFIGNQFPVQILGAPVDQHAAEIEYDCLDGHANSAAITSSSGRGATPLPENEQWLQMKL